MAFCLYLDVEATCPAKRTRNYAHAIGYVGRADHLLRQFDSADTS